MSECLSKELCDQFILWINDESRSVASILERYRPCDYISYTPVWFYLVSREWLYEDFLLVAKRPEWDVNQCDNIGVPFLFTSWNWPGVNADDLQSTRIIRHMLEVGYDATRIHPRFNESIVELFIRRSDIDNELWVAVLKMLLDAGARLDTDVISPFHSEPGVPELISYAKRVKERVAACKENALIILHTLSNRDLARYVALSVWNTRFISFYPWPALQPHWPW